MCGTYATKTILYSTYKNSAYLQYEILTLLAILYLQYLHLQYLLTMRDTNYTKKKKRKKK